MIRLELVLTFSESDKTDLLSLRWPAPPRNILLVKKESAPAATTALREFATHLHSAYPEINVLLEPGPAAELHAGLPPVTFSMSPETWSAERFGQKVDLVVTFGGDGTILHASSLFSTAREVPPTLSFSMGTLGFLGEWRFEEYKRAFREVYMSGAGVDAQSRRLEDVTFWPSQSDDGPGPTGWSSVRGKSMGSSRAAKVLMRSRLKVGVFAADGTPLGPSGKSSSTTHVHAMNEVLIHRGRDPHLAVVEVFVGGRYLTELVGDGMIVSTPTGSTAYSLSSGGSIIHPLVSSILLTPICPRSLSFRPLVLPAGTPITLKLSAKNRGRELEVSIDGIRRTGAMSAGMKVDVTGEEPRRANRTWHGGGVPCIMRKTRSVGDGDDGWVGGLNGLLKFNRPFGDAL